MPALPRWLNHLDRIIADLEALPDPWLDRQTIQEMLGVKPRRAQQIVASCVSRVVGTSALIDRDSFVLVLKRWQSGEAGSYEQKRRRRVARIIHQLSSQKAALPVLPVEAPTRVVNQIFDNLPPGIQLEKGRITIQFTDSKEALEKLLALAMAIGNEYERFETVTGITKGDKTTP
jgi:hypothetical protein